MTEEKKKKMKCAVYVSTNVPYDTPQANFIQANVQSLYSRFPYDQNTGLAVDDYGFAFSGQMLAAGGSTSGTIGYQTLYSVEKFLDELRSSTFEEGFIWLNTDEDAEEDQMIAEVKKELEASGLKEFRIDYRQVYADNFVTTNGDNDDVDAKSAVTLTLLRFRKDEKKEIVTPGPAGAHDTPESSTL